MGIPRFLAPTYEAAVSGQDKYSVFWGGFYAVCSSRTYRHFINVPERAQAVSRFHAAIKFAIKQRSGYREQAWMPDYEGPYSPHALELVEAQRYVGLWKDQDGNLQWEGEPTKIQRRYLTKYEQHRSRRIESEKTQIRKRDELLAFRGKKYLSRRFPPQLRAIILDRDEYRCKICGRSKDFLFRLGLHLQADHIKAWIDGGVTTYSNGQALCSECNKAKHHAKKYLAQQAELEGVPDSDVAS